MANTPISKNGWHMVKTSEKKFKCSLEGIRVSNKQESPVPSVVTFSNSNLDLMNSVAGNLPGNP